MANDNDQSRRPQRRQRRHDNHGTCGGGGRGDSGALCSNTTTTTTSQGQGSYTWWPPYLNPWTATVQMWSGSRGGGVNIQQASPPTMPAGAFPYGLSP
jgi:hypothetical protein